MEVHRELTSFVQCSRRSTDSDVDRAIVAGRFDVRTDAECDAAAAASWPEMDS